MTEREMLDLLNVKYRAATANGIRYTRAEHVKISTGFDASRICDFMAMDLWNGYGDGRGPKLHGHEVKVSRSDWLREVKEPEKAEAFKRYCDYWWLVVSDPGIVQFGELPYDWGLMVARGRGLAVVKEAPRLAPEPMPRPLQATLMRAVTKTTLRLAATADPALAGLSRRMGLVSHG